METNGKINWDEINSQIVARLDVVAEFKSLGIEFVGARPNSKGWIACKAYGRDDKNPSAGVNVSTGRYHDFGGGGEACGLWDFAVRVGKFGDWRIAREHYAKLVGVELPQTRESRTDDSFEFHNLTPGCALLWARRKDPIEPFAIYLAGGTSALWPRARGDRAHHLIAFPMFGHLGIPGGPIGWHSVRVDAKKIIISDKVQTEKMTKGTPGLLNMYGMQHLAQASVVWITEGLTSMLALQTVLGERTDHVVISPGACTHPPRDSYKSLFRGKEVRLIFDLDEPTEKAPNGAGQQGAEIWLNFLIGTAANVRNIILTGERPIDLRDWLAAGNTFGGLLELADKAPTRQQAQRTTSTLSNVVRIHEEGSTKTIAKDSHEIMREMLAATGDWPRRVQDSLFVDDGGNITWLKRSPAMFGWLSGICKIEWYGTPDSVPKPEFYEFVRNRVQQYRAVEEFPHFPRIKSHYYLERGEIRTGDGSTIRKLIDDYFRPDSPEDWDLLYATILTLFWGGQTGTRPAFLFTTHQGRGTGKTTTATAIARLVGGTVNTDKGEKIEDIKKRLLTQESMGRRVVMLDNIKAERFSWAAFESLVTADSISGHQMYQGERSVANNLTWFLTINGPKLSRDIAQRVIPIYLKKPKQYGKRWHEECNDFIDRRRWDIIADIRSAFDRPPKPGFEPQSRWGSWEYEVVGRLPDPDNVQRTILERQSELDEDIETGAHVEEFVSDKLEGLGYDPQSHSVFIPSDVITKWFREAIDEPLSPKAVARRIKQGHGEGVYHHLRDTDERVYHSGGRSRGVVWCHKEFQSDFEFKEFVKNREDGIRRDLVDKASSF